MGQQELNSGTVVLELATNMVPNHTFSFFFEIQLLVTVKITENNLKFLSNFSTTQLILSSRHR
jgi:hypothetical protein